MNLYNSSNPAMAEIVLAKAWAEAARREGQRSRLPAMQPDNAGQPGTRSKKGVLDAVRQYAKIQPGTFTLFDACRDLPQFGKSQLATALQKAVSEGTAVVVGKTVMGLNIYRGTGA